MAKGYRQLGLEERDRITEMMADGVSLREVAASLGRSSATISREVKRNSSPSFRLYLSHRAHERAARRKKEASKRPRLKDERTALYMLEKLGNGWSPEQIARRIGIDCPGLSIDLPVLPEGNI